MNREICVRTFEKTFERPGPKSVRPATNCSGVDVVLA
jgi:hypothetical protein